MRVQATKTMAKELNKALKGTRYENVMTFDAMQVSYDFYHRNVSCFMEDADYDYDARTGKFRSMKVVYNPNLYALSQYITTRDLVKIFRRVGNNWEDFCKEVFAEYEV